MTRCARATGRLHVDSFLEACETNETTWPRSEVALWHAPNKLELRSRLRKDLRAERRLAPIGLTKSGTWQRGTITPSTSTERSAFARSRHGRCIRYIPLCRRLRRASRAED